MSVLRIRNSDGAERFLPKFAESCLERCFPLLKTRDRAVALTAGGYNSVDRLTDAGYCLSIAMKNKLVGRFVVTDPKVCHGQFTFRGTRILVTDVLEQVASGMAWESIVEEWRGSISEEAIAEAVRLASETFRKHAHELALEPANA